MYLWVVLGRRKKLDGRKALRAPKGHDASDSVDLSDTQGVGPWRFLESDPNNQEAPPTTTQPWGGLASTEAAKIWGMVLLWVETISGHLRAHFTLSQATHAQNQSFQVGGAGASKAKKHTPRISRNGAWWCG